MKNGCQSALIELISGLPPKYSLTNDTEDANVLDEPFIFALND